ncbi:MAG: HAMP domain-containing histidine kinase [Gammaproteobacteria bacterium]|nr:HAMP domain-containing histidine kinase [Gammaproteobacteria bacterium]
MKKFCKHLRRFRHTLSGKLIFMFVVAAVVFVSLVGAGVSYAVRQHFRDQVQPNLVKYLDYIHSDIGMPANRDRATRLATDLGLHIYVSDSVGQWSSTGQPFPGGELRDFRPEYSHVKDGVEYGMVENHHLTVFSIRSGGAVQLFSLANVSHPLGPHGLLPTAALLLVLLALYLLTRHLIAPVQKIRKGLEFFGRGDMNHRIHVHRTDELGDLADSFNAMADKVQLMLESKRQLLLAISHELRSPLTRSRVCAEMITDPELSRKIQHDLNEMSKLVEELLETERLSQNHNALNIEHVSVRGLVSAFIETAYPGGQVSVTMPEADIHVAIDPVRIRLLLSNLVSNAIRYTPESQTRPELIITGNDRMLRFRVKDHGEGIAPEHIPRLTEPFYRVDSARQRETGGYGLGLYLCRMIAEAHDGRLEIRSARGRGTQVDVLLPWSGTDPQPD